MSIVKYECQALNCFIECVMINDEPFFKGKSVATILGYKDTKDAISRHVYPEFKKSLNLLMKPIEGGVSPPATCSENNAIFITEAGLYQLCFSSKMNQAKIFTKWVCSEVLPSIRKTGSYQETSSLCSSSGLSPAGVSVKSKWDLSVNGFDDVKLLARGETKLHYRVVNHIRKKYPDILTIAGLGEYQEYDYQRMDAYLKGYHAGQPDITLLKKLKNGHTDVVAIELKNPNGSNELSIKQDEFIKRLNVCNISTFVSNEYDDVIIWLNDHYREVEKKQIQMLPINDVSYDFSTKSNPKYWKYRLRNKANLIKECKKRNMKTLDLMARTNIQIIELLINHDSNNV